jgi:hypothetical protein
MMNENEPNQGCQKKPYEKPELRIIELAAEEVLAAGCKLSFGGSAFGSIGSCMGMNCAGPGS